MDLKTKKETLQEIYRHFEETVREFKTEAVCKPGCAFCCTDVGNVDLTTLEGLVIRERISGLSGKQKARLKKRLGKNRREKENQNIAQCPFLKDDNTCLIYEVRPFSCRQLYSLKKCGAQGPTIHRQAGELAKATVRELQALDDTGYSGHISFILRLLDKADFRKLYLSGGFDPPQIMAYGKAHRIVINRFMAATQSA